jgi:hypothetical protein
VPKGKVTTAVNHHSPFLLPDLVLPSLHPLMASSVQGLQKANLIGKTNPHRFGFKESRRKQKKQLFLFKTQIPNFMNRNQLLVGFTN